MPLESLAGMDAAYASSHTPVHNIIIVQSWSWCTNKSHTVWHYGIDFLTLTWASMRPPPFSWELASFPTHTNTWKPVSNTNTENFNKKRIAQHTARYIAVSLMNFSVTLTISWVQVSLADGSLGHWFEGKVMVMMSLPDPTCRLIEWWFKILKAIIR